MVTAADGGAAGRRPSLGAWVSSLFSLLSIAQRIWPVPVGLLVAAACIFAPRPTAALIEREAEAKGREMAALFDNAILSGLHRHPRSADAPRKR